MGLSMHGRRVDVDYQNNTMLISSAVLWIGFGVLQNYEQQIFLTWDPNVRISHRLLAAKVAYIFDLWTI
jgi:hypothetical protein